VFAFDGDGLDNNYRPTGCKFRHSLTAVVARFWVYQNT